MKKLGIIILLVLMPLTASADFSDIFRNLFSTPNTGDPNIRPLEQFVGTTSPVTGITQRTYGKGLYLTGYGDGCLYLLSGVLTVNTLNATCTSSGGGGSSGGTWSTTTSQVSGQLINYSNNTTDIPTIGATATTTAEFWFDPNIPFAKLGGQVLVTGSTTLQNFTGINSTTTQSTSTSLFSTTLAGTNLRITSLTSALTLTGADGVFAEYAGTSCTNQFVRALSVLGVATCESIGNEDFEDDDWGDITIASNVASVEDDSHAHTGATLSGIDISDDTNLTAGDSLTLTGDDIDCDVASGSVAGCLSTTDWTTFNNKLGSHDEFPIKPSYGGSATSSLVTFSDGILTGNASSTIYKFISVFSTTTQATTTNFFSSTLTATNGFINTLLTAAAATVTGLLDVGGGTLEIPNGTNPTADDPGEIAHDTTSNMLILDDFVVGKGIQPIWGRTIGSTSPAFISAGLLPLAMRYEGWTITDIACKVDTGTSKVIAIEDASANSTEDITCGTSVTEDDGSITNATFTALEEMYIDFGATSGAVDYVTITVYGTITRE